MDALITADLADVIPSARPWLRDWERRRRIDATIVKVLWSALGATIIYAIYFSGVFQ